jgi:hypothetical protein
MSTRAQPELRWAVRLRFPVFQGPSVLDPSSQSPLAFKSEGERKTKYIGFGQATMAWGNL